MHVGDVIKCWKLFVYEFRPLISASGQVQIFQTGRPLIDLGLKGSSWIGRLPLFTILRLGNATVWFQQFGTNSFNA